MDFSHLFVGASLLGIVAALWSRLKALFAWALSHVVVTVEAQSAVSTALTTYFWTHCAQSPYGTKRFDSLCDYIKPLQRLQTCAFEMVGTNTTLFWYGRRPVMLRFTPSGKSELDNSLGSGVPLTMTFIRGTFNVDQLIIIAMAELNLALHGSGVFNERRYFVQRMIGPARFGRGAATENSDSPVGSAAPKSAHHSRDKRLLQYSWDEIGTPIENNNTIEHLALPPQADELFARCRRWLNSKAWYISKRIPWRTGALLHGKPGTGKSSFIRAIAQRLDLPVFSFDLSTFDNRSIGDSWQVVRNNSPCIALFEDIDTVFSGRENVTATDMNPGVSFDCLLNLMSGIEDASGVMIFVTTNRVDLLNEALGKPDSRNGKTSTRPGRVDYILELPVLDEAGRYHIAKKDFGGIPRRGRLYCERGRW